MKVRNLRKKRKQMNDKFKTRMKKQKSKIQRQDCEKETTVSQELTVVTSSGKNSTYELKNTDAFTLKLVAKGAAWVGVTNSTGKYLYQGTLKAEESKALDVKDETTVIINIGRTPDVELYVNDEKLEYAISPTEEVESTYNDTIYKN